MSTHEIDRVSVPSASNRAAHSAWPADPAIPGLTVALDPAAMGARLEAHLRDCGVEARVAEATLEKTAYRPGRHLGVLWRVELERADGKDEHWIHLRALTPEIGRLRFGNAAHRAGVDVEEPLAGVPAFSWWDDVDTWIAFFPLDTRLPHLAEACRRERIEAELGEWSQARGEPAARLAAIRRIKYMPGKRCVLRLDLAARERPPHAIYAKTYPAGESLEHYERLVLARRQLERAKGGFDLPAPLAHWDDLATVWVEDWGGSPLLDHLDAPDWDAHLAHAAEAIAALHGSGLDGLPPAPRVEDVHAIARADLFAQHAGLPERPELARDVLAALERRPGEGGGSVPIHGACRAEQTIVRPDRATLVDLDAFALGDPIQDVAEFVASLEFLAITRGLPWERLERSSAAFLAAYAERSGVRPEPRRLAWHALAFTASKMCSVRQHLNVEAVERLRQDGGRVARRWIETLA